MLSCGVVLGLLVVVVKMYGVELVGGKGNNVVVVIVGAVVVDESKCGTRSDVGIMDDIGSVKDVGC